MSEMILTQEGKSKIADFISECRALRKELLDANKDTSYDTVIPTEEDILSDINDAYVDGDEGYYSCWGVTDKYDLNLSLEYGVDFIDIRELNTKYLKVEMVVAVKEKFADEIKKWEHHIDYAIDLDYYPEIHSISNVKVTEIEEE